MLSISFHFLVLSYCFKLLFIQKWKTETQLDLSFYLGEFKAILGEVLGCYRDCPLAVSCCLVIHCSSLRKEGKKLTTKAVQERLEELCPVFVMMVYSVWEQDFFLPPKLLESGGRQESMPTFLFSKVKEKKTWYNPFLCVYMSVLHIKGDVCLPTGRDRNVKQLF